MTFTHSSFGEREHRLVFFGALEGARKTETPKEGEKSAPNKPGKTPGSASRERAQGAQNVVQDYNTRLKRSIATQFNSLTKSGTSAADAKRTLDVQHPQFELELNGDKLIRVNVKNPNAPQAAPSKSEDLIAGLDDMQKPIVERALSELQNAAPQAKQHMVEFLSDLGKRDERITALGEIQQLVDRLKPEARDRIAPYLASIADGDFSSIDDGVRVRDFVAISLQDFLNDPAKRETVAFSATIFKDIATSGPSKRTKDPNKLGGAPGTAQDELDAIMNDPNMPSATREQQIGMIMFNHGVEVREENGKLVAKEADPNQRFGDLINRFSGFIRFVTALVGSLKSSVDEVKNSIAGKAGLNTPQSGPQNKAEVNKGTQDDPVDADIRKEIKDGGKTVAQIEDDLKEAPPTTKYAVAVEKRNQARADMNTSNNKVTDLEQKLEDKKREADADSKSDAKKDAVLAAEREIRNAKNDAETKTDTYNDAQQDLAKLDAKKKALEDSKKNVDEMKTALNKQKNSAKVLLDVDVDGLKNKPNAKELLTVLANDFTVDNDKLLIKVDNAANIVTVKNLAKKYPPLGDKDSTFESDGDKLTNPRAFTKLIEDLANQIKTRPDA